ncbi:ABC-type transport auxiliary lipoprotein family protein [Faunimonas sp. B44]|uniref:ABC-type transport auxiliary lipoprotein family protein n=1 Tax=Faunimonas sp. B44 TaxID=3461493 RepID=UPI0040449A72
MEIRARFVLVGLMLLAVAAGGFGFVYWLKNIGGLGERTAYRVRFEGSVAGLLLGSPVQFNGIKVGEVIALDLDPDRPREVLVTIAVASRTPVRADTAVGLTYAGLTGVPEIVLTGGSEEAPRLSPDGGEPPLLVAPAGSNVNWTDSAREAFTRVEAVLKENAPALKSTFTNLDTFSSALSRNADRVDDIMDGLARLAGARPGAKSHVVYALGAPPGLPVPDRLPEAQLVINEPSIAAAFNTPQFVSRAEGGRKPIFEDAVWSDTVPKAVQVALIRSFEEAGYTRVGRDFQGISEDYLLLVDILAFDIVPGPAPSAEFAIAAKLTTADGAIVAARRFAETAALAAVEPAASADALAEAFGAAAALLVPWAMEAMVTAETETAGADPVPADESEQTEESAE